MTDQTINSKEANVSSVSDHGIGTSENIIDPELEKRYVRKLDWNILPMVMFMQLVSFLDRSNIGNAKINGMTKDIHLTGSGFNVAASIFYVTYIAFEAPYNIMQQRFGASRVLPAIIISWSLVTIFSGFITNYGGLLASRLVLGMCESGLFPGLNFYLSSLYTRDEYAKRVCMLFVATALSGAFGGLIAFGVLQIGNVSSVAGWRWLFYIEGLMSLVVGIFAVFFLPSSAEDARFLTTEQKYIGKLRLARRDEDRGNNNIQWGEIRAALTSSVCWISGLIQFGGDVCLYSFSVFLPTIIQGMGYQSLKVQYLTIPIYLWGAFIYILVVMSMDWFHYDQRSTYMIVSGLFTAAGYAILIGCSKTGVQYFACFLCATGLYLVTGLNITWIGSNTKGRYKRAMAIAMNQTLGNAGGVVAGQIYIATNAPRYITGHSVSLASICVAILGTILAYTIFRRRNMHKAKKSLESGAGGDGNSNAMGDDDIHFKYML